MHTNKFKYISNQEVGGHEQLQGNFGLDGEFRNLRGAVGVPDLVREVHADLERKEKSVKPATDTIARTANG